MSLQASTSRLFLSSARQFKQPRLACCLCTCATTRTNTSSNASTKWQRSQQQARSESVTKGYSKAPYSTSIDTSPPEVHDIVIVGGGLVGLALANALSTSSVVQSAGTKISLLEASDLDKVAEWSLPPGKWSNRISSITSQSQRFLTETGGWQKVDMARTRPCEEMRVRDSSCIVADFPFQGTELCCQVWDGLSNARIEFSAWDSGERSGSSAEMAKFVENMNLQRALLRNVQEAGNVEVIDKTKVLGITQGDLKEQGGWPIVQLENARAIRARLLVGADGFNSPVKNYSEIKTDGWAYDAHCLVGTLELEANPMDTNMIAWQRFLPVGPLGFLPIADTYASLAWSTKPEIAAALKKLDSETLSALINASFRLPWSSLSWLYQRLKSDPSTLRDDIAWRSSSQSIDRSTLPREHTEVPPIVKAVHLDTCASFPLKMSHAQSYLGDTDVGGLPKRTALIGDAAHTVHPMAGQGLNLGLGDAQSLFETLEKGIAEGADIGSKLALHPYPRQRYFANHTVMNVIDKLHKLYAQEAAPIVWARSTGVEILNELPKVKAAMMGTAGSKAGGKQSAQSAVWGGVAKAYEVLEGARELSTVVKTLVKNRIASAASK